MTAIARESLNLQPEQPGPNSPKVRYHTAAGECLALGQYYRPQKYAPHALLNYAHCVSLKSLDPSHEAAAMVSMAVRLAYQMGYHRDPDVFGTFSPFEGEMRRRFWAACKQVDMMTAFQLGLPSNIRLENCDTKSPRNLLDSDFGAHAVELPPSRSEDESTGVLWFIVKDRLTSSFHKVCQDALSLNVKSTEHVRRLDQEIREAHESVPVLLRVRPILESYSDTRFMIMARYYLELLHLKSLAILHRKRMMSGDLWSTSRCIEAGLSIVRMVVEAYKEFAPGGHLHQVRWMFNCYYMSDFLLGVMVLCLYNHLYKVHGHREGLPDVEERCEVSLLLEQALGICVEKSPLSRDARKVSLAIRIALRSKQKVMPDGTDFDPTLVKNGLPPASGDSSFAFQSMPDWFDASSLANAPFDSDMSFEALDPFNFLGTDPLDFNVG